MTNSKCKSVAATLAVIGLSVATPAPFAIGQNRDEIRVTVNGRDVEFDNIGPREYNGRVLVPLRGVLETLGATVEWSAENQTVYASNDQTTIELPIGSRFARVNNSRIALDVPATTIAGTTMVPLRFLSESLGASVQWNSENALVRIETDSRAAYRSPRTYRPSNAYRRSGNTVGRLPIVRSVTTDLDEDGWVRDGETITVTMRGTPGGRAWFRIRGVVGEQVMREEEPGTYVGHWTSDRARGTHINQNDILAFVLVGDRASAEQHP